MRHFILIAVLVAATFAIYQQSWHNQFVLDDMTKIEENSDLRTPFRISNFIYPYADNVMHFRNDPSRPLTFVLYWVCWQLGGGSVVPFHILSTAAHAGTAVLLALLTLQLSVLIFKERSWTAAMIAGGLFLTSPLMAGTVVYPFGLSDVICALFTLAMLNLLVEMQTVSRPRMILAVGFYVMALLSKQAGFVAPALLIAIDYFTGKGNTPWRKLHIYTPLLSMSAIYLILRYLYFGGIGDLEGANETLPWMDYCAVEGIMILKYLWHTVVPVGLSIDHQPFPDQFSALAKTSAWILIGMLTAFAMTARWSKFKRIKVLSLAWIFFLICLLPTSSILPTVDLFVERRAYYADLGFFMAAGLLLWQLAKMGKWKWIALGGAAAAISAQAGATVQRAHVYGDPELLWKESLQLEPKNTRALINLGVYYSKIEKWDESRQTLEDLLKLRPDNGSIYSKLAYIYHQKSYAGRNDELAWKLYQKSLELMPDNIFALYNTGVFLMEMNRNAEAVQFFLKAARLSPAMSKSWIAAGQAALLAGDRKAARKYLETALQIDPSLELPQRLLKELQ